uniref:DUF1542 domain-containing protein n=1 Tax=Lactobacillus johnsonii TaxID=33959 RepID=UPI0022E38E67
DAINGLKGKATSLEDAKKAANKVVEDAVDKQKALITKANNLSDKEKQALNNQVDAAAKTAKDAITAAKTNDVATKAGQDGKTAIEAVTVPTDSDVKKNAKNAIDQAAKAKDGAIDASNLTAEEKDTLKQTVAGEVQTAKDNIDAATKDADVTTAKDTGVETINNINVPTTSATKDAAINAINTALADKKTAINGTNLTAEEKSTLVNQAQQLVEDAIANINKATTNDAVNTAKETGVETINNVNVPATSATKDDGIKAIDAALDNKKSEINNATNIDQATKDNLIQAATDAANKAKEAINQATTNNDVATEQTKGTNAIDAVKVPSLTDSQSAAKDVVDTAVAKQKELINNSNNLSDSEKQDLNQQVDAATKTAKDAIDAATTNDGATKAGQDGVAAIEAVTVPADSSVKKNAKNAIDQAAKTKDNAIDASNLTTEEKDALKKKVAGEVKIAKDNIDAATKDADVTTAQTNGEKAINAVEIPTSSKTKNDANSALDTTADAAKKAIDKTSGLTDDQKQTAKDQIDQVVDAAKENIKNASDNKGIADATDAGKLAIDKVSAKAAIDAAVAAKKSKIAKTPLTAEEAKPLNDLVDQETDAAKDAIDAATTNAVVEAAKNNGVETINNINVPATSATKDDANKGNFPDGSKVTVGDDGTATVTYPDGSKDTIPGRDLIIGAKGEGISGNKHDSNSSSGSNGTISNTDDETSGDTVNNAESMNGNTAKSGSKNNSLKTLPQTGNKDVTILEILGLFLSLFGLLGLKKKHREE